MIKLQNYQSNVVTSKQTARQTAILPLIERKDPKTARPTVSVVIPTLNEAENLPFVIPFLPDIVTEVIIVDGRSTDNTIEVAKVLCPNVKIVLEPRKGKGVALRSGFEAATGDVIVMMDADGSTDPAEIPGFIGLLEAGADFVKGSRFMQGGKTHDMELHRYLGNMALTYTVRALFGGKYSDLCYGYAAFWRRCLPDLALESTGFEIETEMNIRALRAKLNIAEAASWEKPRVHGESNLNALRDGIRIMKVITNEFVDQVRYWLPWLKSKQQLESDKLSNAIQLLLREAMYIRKHKEQFDPQRYQQSIEYLKASVEILLNQEPYDANERLEQTRIRAQGENIWKFLES